jgi:hypothetical protein
MAAPCDRLALVDLDQGGRLIAAVDLVITRPDLPGIRYCVRAGHVIPAELADLPRRRRP